MYNVFIFEPLSNSLSSLSSRKNGIAFGGAYHYPWFCKKRTWTGTEKEKEKKRKRKGKGKGKEKAKAKARERKRTGKGKGEKEQEKDGKGKGKERKGKEKGRKQEKERKGSVCGLGLLFEQMGIAKVSLISPLACTQLCAKQLQMWTLCTI